MRIRRHVGSVDIDISDARLRRNFKKAQRKLDEDVLRDTTPYVPKGGTGYLRGSGHIVEGGGEVIWDANYAHFQYVGHVLTDENGRVWVRKNEEKPVDTGRLLRYQEPGAEREFFEAAKRDHKNEWLADVRKEIDKR